MNAPTPQATQAHAHKKLHSLALAGAILFTLGAGLLRGQTLANISNRMVQLTGTMQVHLTDPGDPMPNCTINFTSPDAFLYLEKVPVSKAIAGFMSRFQVNGESASLDGNLLVTQYDQGSVIIPHGAQFAAMTVYDGVGYAGQSAPLQAYTPYDQGRLGGFGISSFHLKHGYEATLAANPDGTGISRNYVAQDHDVDVANLPEGLDKQVKFLRIYPWKWVGKKGIAGNIWQNLNCSWYYNWNITKLQSPDIDYTPIKQNLGWPGIDRLDWKNFRAINILGYNEPDNKLQANIPIDKAVAGWSKVLATGLRVGTPAPTDGGLGWLYQFIAKCDAQHLRIDYVAVHYYRGYGNPGDPDGAAKQLYNFLAAVHEKTHRPIWITEWNNGANWTKTPKPDPEQQKAAISKMIEMLDKTPWVERYALYNWVEDCRMLQRKDNSLTPAGEAYRDEYSPVGYVQVDPMAPPPDAVQAPGGTFHQVTQ